MGTLTPMKITKEWLKKQGACDEGVLWFESQKASDLETVAVKLMEKEHFDWANWGIVRLMSHPQKVAYAAFAARQVLRLFEEKYPADKRPRLAIEAAERFAAEPTEENKKTAASAASAAYAAAASAAAASASAAASAAAYAAAASAAAAYAAAAASAAAYAASASAASASASAMKRKIILHGLKLLTGKDGN